MTNKLRVVVLISGGGTTLRNLIDCTKNKSLPIDIVGVVSSTESARGLLFAEGAGIPSVVLRHAKQQSLEQYSESLFDYCRQAGAQLVVMAGWLKLLRIPEDFADRVVNIHPALIPAFCGQGMYGQRVHEAVLAKGAKVSGCTVHFVDNQYDHGPIIAQRAVPVLADDTPHSLAARVFAAECELYPTVLRWIVAAGKIRVEGRQVRFDTTRADS
ncbi:MAG: phosphoribosylglycinamide formyltransferase [Planctomycetota bacterium]|nr:phosphoribosylglycinamide formyltransferase [Planctomycetota bacterium]